MSSGDFSGESTSVSVEIPDVDSWLNTLNNYAKGAIANAGSAASSLLGFEPDNFDSQVDFEAVNTDLPDLTGVAKPTPPRIDSPVRNPPSPPSLSTPTITLGTEPVFNVPDPSINLPDVPSPLDAILPVKDFILNLDYEYPIEPDTTLPTLPTFETLNIPTPEELFIPTFDLDFPTSTHIEIPGITFAFNEELYSSPLLTSVKDELLQRISGGSGIDPIVEEAIWNRGRDRESRAAVLAKNDLLNDRASLGFTRPPGSAQAALDKIMMETQSKIIDLSREIMIKQAELEQENIKTSIQQTIALEDILIKNHENMVQRAFETAKYLQDLAIEIFKVKVSLFNSEVEAYKAFAQAYEARLRAELAKVEIFKAQIDAEKLKGDINEQNIRIYLAQIDAIKNNVEIYKALVATISEKLKGEELKLQSYKTDVEAYSEVVKAKATEYSLYSEQIKGELTKVEVFSAKAKAFADRVQAYAATSNVKIKKAELESTIEELKLKKYEADIEAFIKQVQADQLIYQSAVDLYKGQVQMYLGDIEAVKGQIEIAIKEAENIILQNKYEADIGIQNAQLVIQAMKAAYDSAIQAQSNAGSIYQGIAASALNAINVSASVTGQAQVQGSESLNINSSA